ncbi:MAG TPA: hypothetical protein VJ955_05390 [Desulfuromonadales bacterium]|nr:hypothetical protein [Desulfuromonadales bacterium]
MGDQKISKAIRKVRLTLADGRSLAGEIFLNLYEVRHAGQQRVGDLLNGDVAFLPVRVDCETLLVNVEQILSARVAAADELDELMTLGERYTVEVVTLSGDPIVADLYVNLPSGSCRVTDYLNRPQRFFTFVALKEVLYFNRRFVLAVRD